MYVWTLFYLLGHNHYQNNIVKGVVISTVGLGSNPGKTILNGDRDTAIQVQT